MYQRGFSLILLPVVLVIVVVGVVGTIAYLSFSKNNSSPDAKVVKTSQTPLQTVAPKAYSSPSALSSSQSASFENPFDENTQYANPFDENQNPFNNLE